MVQSLEQPQMAPNLKAKKFVLWLFVASSTIMFGGWTSYYVVFSASKGKGHGLVLPEAFIYSTVVLLLSSICLWFASRALKSNNKSMQRTALWATLFLGLVFGYLQFMGWTSLYLSGAALVNNNASISMIYVVSGFHLLHVLAGVVFVINTLIGSYKNIPLEREVYRQDIAAIFWHFIDILWIYLYVFLLLNA